uniref:Transposable element P transposase-like GTP-binding insertion domain-containing protein n=1 Tax=Amphimedon queenslandica TaxID=400682 RepID=A0A1X7UZK1_AMPQE
NMKTPKELAALSKMKICIGIHEQRIRRMKKQLRESGMTNAIELSKELEDKSQEDDTSNGKGHEYVATDMLTLMVMGIFFMLKYPYASFPTKGITADKLYWIVWEAIRRLEESNLKINGKYILWEQLLALYDYKESNIGLFLGHHLTYDHLYLTSYSKMKVLSNSVTCGFEMMNNDDYTETGRFCCMFDRFFACLNTRHFGEGRNKRKPDLEPYCTVNDAKLEWLESDFLGYLKEWENYTEVQNDLTKEEKNKVMLSRETRQGLKITVLAFVELTQFLLTQRMAPFSCLNVSLRIPLNLILDSKELVEGV